MLLALFFTVILLAISAYFFMGSVPLLVLQHDTPLDARFVRGFFNTYYLLATVAACLTALAYALAGRLLFASGAAAFAVLAIALRRAVIPKMDALGAGIQLAETHAIPGFRRLHAVAILVNLTQLVLAVWALVSVSMQMK